MIKLIKEELKKYKKKLKKLRGKEEEKIYLEIKIGVGGEESNIFISDLKKMYEKYIEKMKWKKTIISETKTSLKGYKEVIMLIKGKKVYSKLKYESGVHRVQRFPITENRGRLHTSTCKVAVYKYLKNKKFKIKNDDLKIESFKSSGAGGQHVNKTNSAVRIKHIPTNIVVECQKERSQHKNKKHALKLIKIKILNMENEKKEKNIKVKKKKLFGKGSRSEKIRTYNFKNNRISDHRFKINVNNINSIMKGNFEKLIKKIKIYEKKNKN
ncbi:hypothetical protein NDNC_0340 [Candidatus Nasuia deltocephalinicola]|nr:hypothetical protein NDNC_0340 [Candidatus Nasuia deltocephalinicola]